MPSPTDAPKQDKLAQDLREHAAAIAYLCRSIVGPSQARDACQESYERIVRHAASFDESRGSFRTWAFAIARNVCRDFLRKRGRESLALLQVDDTDLAFTHGGPAPDTSLSTKLDLAALDIALTTLPEPMRTALVLFHMHDASYEEIAHTLEVPIGTVMTWLHRGRARLRARLETV